jgi:transposase, IS30 family
VAVGAGRPGFLVAVRARFWDGVRSGLGVREAAAGAGVSRRQGQAWFREAGGVPAAGAVAPGGRYLSLAEREEVAVGLAAGLGPREIGRRLGRPASTVSREVRRNESGRGYRATAAQARAEARARRPKAAKLAVNGELRAWVQGRLERNWSPEQVSARLAVEFPGRPEMRVSAETVYQSLYVQGRGALRRELAAHLRTGRALRRPRRKEGERRGRIPGMVNISERPPEAADRAVPGHWEGDLIEGKGGKSQIGTLVERATRFTMLIALPGGKGPDAFADAVTPVIAGLPDALRRSLAWDQGNEMQRHARIAVAADCEVYFCDPHSPWQRPSNENTNGLLRQYFPKGTGMPADPERLRAVADELNGRPRKVLGWKTPAEALAEFLDSQAALPGNAKNIKT